MTLRTLVALLILLLAPLPVLAFGNCSDPGYQEVFGEPAGATTCDVRHEFLLTFNGHSYPVRVISTGSHGDDTVWIAAMNDALANIALWAEAMGPNLKIQPTTIFLTDRIRVAADGGHVRGARLGASWNGECDIGMYKLDEDFDVSLFGFTIAHEMFHCIQVATWPNQWLPENSKWWKEGSATYFASVAYPEVGLDVFQNGFAAEIGQTSLFAEPLDYETVVFFDRIAQLGGSEAVGRFITALPADGDYLHNLQGQFGMDDWATFAEAYLLGQVLDAAGNAIPEPTGDPVVTLSGDFADVALSTDAYRIYRTTIKVSAGTSYEVSVEGSADLRARITLDRSSWTDLPQTVDACAAERNLTLYAVTTQGPQDFHIRATNQGPCSACATAQAADSCLVGTWLMTGGGPIEWMRANGMPADIRMQQSDVTFRLSRGGALSVNPVRTDIRAEDEDVVVDGESQSQGYAGHWGAADGVLHFCPLSGELAATSRMNGQVYFQDIFGPGPKVQVTYTCAGDTLTTTMPIPGLPPMDTIYTRTGP